MDTIKQKAEAFTLSYGRAMEQSLAPTPDRAACAKALAAHYAPKWYPHHPPMPQPAEQLTRTQ